VDDDARRIGDAAGGGDLAHPTRVDGAVPVPETAP